MSTMLYKADGPHKIHGDKFDYIITDDVDGELKNGWFKTTPEALAAKKSPKKAAAKKTKKD